MKTSIPISDSMQLPTVNRQDPGVSAAHRLPDECCFLEQSYSAYRKEFLRRAHETYGLTPEIAIDIYQNAVIVLFENHRQEKLADLPYPVKTYLYGIAQNLIIDHFEKQSPPVAHDGAFWKAAPKRRWLTTITENINQATGCLFARGGKIIRSF